MTHDIALDILRRHAHALGRWFVIWTAAALLAGCAGTWDVTCRHEPELRTSLAVTDVALLAVDAGQSRWMVDHYAHDPAANAPLHESNPVLGRYPSKTAVTVYCGAWAAAVVAGRLWLPRWASWGLSTTVLVIETGTIAHDWELGERPTW